MRAYREPGAKRVEKTGLVSVVLNFLNAAPFLEEAISSVSAQSYANWELLLVDDGSTDGSTEIAKSYAVAEPERVRYLHHPEHENMGTSAARNLGLIEARGEFVAFLDADDVWLPQRLERSLELLRANPDAHMVYGETQYWYSWAGSVASYADRIQPHGFKADCLVPAPRLLIRYLSNRAALPCMGSITVRRRSALDCGGFVESFRGMYDDQAFLARFCLHYNVFVSHECWDRYRQHSASLCAQATRDHMVNKASELYLQWLRGFIADQGAQTKGLWVALWYAEQAVRLRQRGFLGKIGTRILKSLLRIPLGRI